MVSPEIRPATQAIFIFRSRAACPDGLRSAIGKLELDWTFEGAQHHQSKSSRAGRSRAVRRGDAAVRIRDITPRLQGHAGDGKTDARRTR